MSLNRLREILADKERFPTVEPRRQEMLKIVEELPTPLQSTVRYLEWLPTQPAAAQARIAELRLRKGVLAVLAKLFGDAARLG